MSKQFGFTQFFRFCKGSGVLSPTNALKIVFCGTSSFSLLYVARNYGRTVEQTSEAASRLKLKVTTTTSTRSSATPTHTARLRSRTVGGTFTSSAAITASLRPTLRSSQISTHSDLQTDLALLSIINTSNQAPSTCSCTVSYLLLPFHFDNDCQLSSNLYSHNLNYLSFENVRNHFAVTISALGSKILFLFEKFKVHQFQNFNCINSNFLSSSIKVNASVKEESGYDSVNDDALDSEPKSGDVFHMREQRFLHFASVVYNGEVYMTPQDFLNSVTQEGARARKYRIAIDGSTMSRWLKQTPSRRRGDNKMFRSLNEQGIISYVEYLFLLCILTEPKSGFEIAFNMFDIDGNRKVDVDEFKVLTKLFSQRKNAKQLISTEDSVKASDLPKAVYSVPSTENEKLQQAQPTTLLIHLFGSKGTDVLTYEDFARFTQNLQEEVLDMEFQQYARGLTTISEEDFARILLRYTNLSESSIEEYLVRVRDRILKAQGINFKDFKNFFLFLNHMDDFILMMRLYNISDQPISKEEFRRAVSICGGEDISLGLIDSVYTIFDVDGDGSLSTEEFISIMKSRLKRGLKTHLVKEEHGWPKFKTCVRHEMRLKRGGM